MLRSKIIYKLLLNLKCYDMLLGICFGELRCIGGYGVFFFFYIGYGIFEIIVLQSIILWLLLNN
jgi:hypothetical protein